MKRLFLDLETTGTIPGVHAIHQLSGCIEVDGEIESSFDFRIRPWEGAKIEQEAMDKCDVTEEQIMSYEASQEHVFKTFMSILDRYIDKYDKFDKVFLIGYNVSFDKGFLVDYFIRNGNDFLFAYIWGNEIDVMSLAGRILQNKRHLLENFKLSTVCEFMGIEVEEEKLHDSKYDIYLTRELFYLVDGEYDTKYQNVQESVVIKVPTNIDIETAKIKVKEMRESYKDLSDDEINAAQKDIEESYPIPPTNLELQTATVKLEDQDRGDTFKIKSIEITQPTESMGDVLEPMEPESKPNPITDSMKNLLLGGIGDKPVNITNPSNKVKTLKKVKDKSFVLYFGKHKGKTIETIMLSDCQWLMWAHDGMIQGFQIDNIQLRDEIYKLAQKQKAEFFANKNPNYKGPGSTNKPFDKSQHGGSDTTLDHKIDNWDNPFDDDMPF